ncbi:LuxR C-terminal-related transcriptional regulator [Marivita sp. XM-24bin2]|uniref:LuxR C-terminal-related transcriptional regulator n=1 Tax=unclassified Marivita TaxID=2632480 RepID=UPI000D7A904F|nr:LuxR C-terminal-related transcriptional regulator [Marivita sp. XM-24bin2]MCR9109127.1 LuxR C-terminal-related transcriptional regulator [Paracoccaceae bacterium]PWL36945.1 MAG: histidine kinase [Marivita sp. XM-24bin2]
MAGRADLSHREVQIARAYASGQTYQSIANTLCIAPSTVRTHLASIYRKLDVSSKLELVNRLEGNAPEPRSPSELAKVVSELALSLEEAISREKALTEVLRIINAGQGDLNAVMPLILTYALELCDAEFGILFEYQQDGRFLAKHAVGIPKPFEIWLKEQGVFTVGPDTGLGRMDEMRTAINIMDVKSEAIYQTNDPLRYATADLGGARSFVAIPMLAGDSLVGAFTIYRQTVRPFSDDTIRLAQMFAAQSVIALENARMIKAIQQASS